MSYNKLRIAYMTLVCTRLKARKEKLQKLTKKLQRQTKCPAFFRNYTHDELTPPPAIITKANICRE